MKNFKFILFLIFFFFLTPYVKANTIDIDSFYELMNSLLQNGDVYSITNNLDSTSTIDTHFYNYSINFEGHNNTMDGGDNFGGFILGENNNFNEIIMRHFKGQAQNNSYFAGAIYNSGGHTEIHNSNFIENYADSNRRNFAVAGAVYNLYGGSMTIENTSFENNYTSGAGSYGGAISNGYNDNVISSKYFGVFKNCRRKEVNEAIDRLIENGKIGVKKISFGRPVLCAK